MQLVLLVPSLRPDAPGTVAGSSTIRYSFFNVLVLKILNHRFIMFMKNRYHLVFTQWN